MTTKLAEKMVGENQIAPPPIYKTPDGEQMVQAMYDRLLAQWPVPYTTARIATRHGETFTIACGPTAPRAGDGELPPVLLLHGAASNALAWMGDVAALSRRQRVYVLDLPGEPGRSSPNRPPWTGPAYVEWLDDVLAGLGIAEASLVGISQGGWVALKYATAQPLRVPRLVLLAPAGVTTARLSFLLRALALMPLGSRGGAAINRIVMGGAPLDAQAVEYMNLIMAHFKSRVGALPNFDDAELARLTMPTLLIAGEQDAIYPSAQTAARLQRVAPHLTVHLLPDAGHVLHGRGEEIAAFLA
jgi:pimeloyl-ACP methyl ester carboxylesterase